MGKKAKAYLLESDVRCCVYFVLFLIGVVVVADCLDGKIDPIITAPALSGAFGIIAAIFNAKKGKALEKEKKEIQKPNGNKKKALLHKAGGDK